MPEPEYYFCALQPAKRAAFRPGNNYDNRFSGGNKKGKSHFNLSTERRRNTNVVDAVVEDLIVEDEKILKLFNCDGMVAMGHQGVFIEFKKENDKFKAVGIPLADSGSSFMGYLTYVWPFSDFDLPFIFACCFNKFNNHFTKSLEENIAIDMSRVTTENDFRRLIMSIKDLVDESPAFKTPISELYVYNSDPSKADKSLYHVIKEALEKNEVFMPQENKRMVEALWNYHFIKLHDDFAKRFTWSNDTNVKVRNAIKTLLQKIPTYNNVFKTIFMSKVVDIIAWGEHGHPDLTPSCREDNRHLSLEFFKTLSNAVIQ